MRRRVRCWKCGNRARRVASTRGIMPSVLDDNGMVRVVLSDDIYQPHGACGAYLDEWSPPCAEPMLLTNDARTVLKAAIEYDRQGWNRMSEYD